MQNSCTNLVTSLANAKISNIFWINPMDFTRTALSTIYTQKHALRFEHILPLEL
jgi:hypothetical protein